MNKAGLLLPPAFLLLGVALGHYFRAPAGGPIPPVQPASPAPATAGLPDIPAPRPTQPVLADWWDFLQTLDRATLADLPALWTALPLPESAPPASPGNSARHQMLIERWTELDPTGALAFVKEKARDGDGLFVILFQTWARQDPETALATLQGETEPKIQSHGVAGFLLSFKEDPAKLIHWAKRFNWLDAGKLEDREFTAACPDDLLRRLLDADRLGLYEIAAHLPPWFLQRLETLTLLQQATTDLPAVLATLKDRPFTKDEAVNMVDQLATLSKSAPASALAILEALRTASGGVALIAGNSSHDLGSTLVKYLAAKDPKAAVTFIKQHLDGSAKLNISSTAYYELLATNPAAALVIATAIPLMPNEIMPVATFKDRQTALSILPDAPPSWRRDQAIQVALDQWRTESPEAAVTWLKSLPEGEWRDRAATILEDTEAHSNVVSLKLQAITVQDQSELTESVLDDVRKTAGQAAQSDLPGTLNTLADWPPGPARQAALLEAAKYAATGDTAGTLAKIQQLTNPSVQADGIRGVLAIWTAHEPLAASEWLPTLTPGPMRESAVDSFAETIAALDPSASLAWAATLTDPAARFARLEITYRKWVTDDPAAAAAALGEIPGLSRADLQQLRTPPAPATK